MKKLLSFTALHLFIISSPSYGSGFADSGAAVSRGSESNFDINRVERLLENAFSQSNIAQVEGKDVVLFLGNTQVGKSTMINYLLGTQYNFYEDFLLASGDEEVAKRGNGTNSETTHSEVYTKDGLYYYYCDTQGLGDTKGKEEPIVSSLIMEMVVNAAKSIKIVIPFSEAEMETGAKGIRDFCFAFNSLCANRDIPILFAYNQKNPRWNKNTVFTKIDSLLESEKKRLITLGVESGGKLDTLNRFASSLYAKVRPDPEGAETQNTDNMSFLNNSSVVDQVNKISTLWMLNRMLAAKEAVPKRNVSLDLPVSESETNLLFLDVLDTTGKNKMEFLSGIDALDAVGKEYFKFSKLSGFRPNFDETNSRLLKDFIDFLELKRNSEKYLGYVTERFSHVENYKSYLDFMTMDIEKKLEKGQYPDISRLLQEMEEKERILKRDIETERTKYKDADKEITRCREEIKLLNAPNQPVVWKEYKWNEGIPLWNIFTGWRYFGAYYTINYVGMPFTDFKEIFKGNTKREGKETIDSTKGVFNVNYGTDYESYSEGEVKIFREKKDLEATKLNVQSLNNKISEEEDKKRKAQDQIDSYGSKISKIVAERDVSLNDARKGMELDIESKRLHVQEVEEILAKLSGFLTFIKVFETMDSRRIDTWYKISKNLQRTRSDSISSKISQDFVKEYEKRPSENIPHVIECPITIEPSEQFVRLSCSHILSLDGYNMLTSGKDTFPCPLCRSSLSTRDSRTTNKELSEAQFEDLMYRHIDTLELLSRRFDRMKRTNALFANNAGD